MGSKLSTRSNSQSSEKKDSTSTATPTADTVGHYALLGLGRGVDITNHSRWLEGTSFQVRQVAKESIVEIDNGRHLTGQSAEVESKTTLEAELKAGANLPASVNIVAEYTRSQLSKKYIVATKISNRTVSFAQGFADIPHLTSDRQPTNKKPNPPVTREPKQANSSSQVEATTVQGAGDTLHQEEVQPLTQSQPSLTDQGSSGDDDELLEDDEDDKKTFEQRLQDWLIECRQQRSQKQVSEIGTNDDFEDTKRFVWHFGITHYVSAIELGAVSYKVVAEEKYESSSAVGHNASLDVLPYGGLHTKSKVKSTKNISSRSTNKMMVGRITKENFVAQSDEAVIGYGVKPISSLVKDPHLHHLLECSMMDYIRKQCSGKYTYLIISFYYRLLHK